VAGKWAAKLAIATASCVRTGPSPCLNNKATRDSRSDPIAPDGSSAKSCWTFWQRSERKGNICQER